MKILLFICQVFLKVHGGPEMNADYKILSAIDKWIGALRDAVGDEIGIAIDLNFNFKTEGIYKSWSHVRTI